MNLETRRIGALDVPVVGLGCNNFGRRTDEEGSRAVIETALEEGVTFFDTADIYGDGRSEEFIGRTLASRRDEVVLATKFGGNLDAGGGRASHIREAVEASLRRLGTDRIDLYQLHSPDPDTPIEETLGALDELVRAGTVQEIGCSNFTAEMLREADAAAARLGTARFVSVQNEYSLLETHDDALGEADRLGIAYIPYFPLGSGLLTGKFRRDAPLPEGSRIERWWTQQQRDETLTEETWDRVERLTAFAAQREHTLLELAFAWLLSQRPVASVIAGATRPEQIRANVEAASWRLDRTDVDALR
jgi:aryl-alcohol dehydrogenase-like predicted oxidoreductase